VNVSDFSNLPNETLDEKDLCNVYWADILHTNISGSCFKGIHMLATFSVSNGVKEHKSHVQVCGFPFSTKEDFFKPSTLIKQFSPKGRDKTFKIHPKFRLRSNTFCYHQTVCVDVHHLMLGYGKVGKLQPRLCNRFKKVGRITQSLSNKSMNC
jgi:hypothetical protein